MRMTGAEILVKTLEELNVDTVFGYPGGAALPLYDALYDTKNIRHIRTCHEQAAAHAADGYARSTGKVGVVFSTSGPGATNLVTGIATAYMDSVPLVAVTGQVGLSLLGKDSFQEVDTTGITLPITKHNYLVRDVNKLQDTVREAFKIAVSGRPGPVLIDLPKDVAACTTEYRPYKKREKTRGPKLKQMSLNQIEKAVDAINYAHRPVLYVGGGVVSANAGEFLKDFIDKARIPVVTTLMGLSAFPGDNPLFLGMLGMHGTAYANYAVSQADLLIALGARFDDRVVGQVERFAPGARIIHVDIDPAEIGKNITTHIPIVGDVAEVLKLFTAQVSGGKYDDWILLIQEWKNKHPLKWCDSDKLKPQHIITELSKLTKGDAIITTEVGQNQMWAAQFYRFKHPGSFITSGGLGTMGYGFPAAIGAKIANPFKPVIDVAGDGSFRMNCNELATAVTYKVPVIVLILNNGTLGMVKQWQELFYKKRYSQVYLDKSPDFIKLAEAYGAKGYRITQPEEVVPTLTEALKSDIPVVIDCLIDPDENVFPMVPAGKAIDEMMGI
jgi:acetolactate synthase-1/2/3 large subunit